MTDQVISTIGSGTLPHTRGILPASQRGVEPQGEGVRRGIQVVVANTEDFTSVDTFSCSGVVVGTTPVEIVGPGLNPLPRIRNVVIQNNSGNEIFIGPRQDFPFLEEGFGVITASAGEIRELNLPILHNVSVWARTLTGTANVRILMY